MGKAARMSGFAVLVAPLLLAGATAATAAAAGVSVALENLAGSGCGRDDTTFVISPDGREVTTLFDRLRASQTASSNAERKRDCKVAFKVTYPSGTRLAVQGGRYRGWHALGSGALATVKVNYRYMGSTDFTTTERTITGPDDGLWEVAEPTARPLVTACGGGTVILMVDHALLLHGKEAVPSQVALTAGDRLYLASQPCTHHPRPREK